jgi:DNA topoisomerase-3
MQTIGKQVDNPVLKKMLKKTSGIGTEATRASIIEMLLKRGFIRKQGKKQLISSDNARILMDALPEPVKNPVMTAVWEQALEEIAQGQRDAEQFLQDQINTVTRLTEQVKQQRPESFGNAETTQYRCPECDQPLRRKPAKKRKGFFWGCSGYPDCKATLLDEKGKPGTKQKEPKPTGKGCPECGEGQLIERRVKKGKNKGKKFLGCNCYPKCSYAEG